MPYGNGTGPNGLGPMQGRGLGFCAGNGARGCPYPGRGMGFGRGGGRGGRGGGGWGWGYRASFPATGMNVPVQPLTEDEQIAGIDDAIASLKQQLDALDARATALRAKKQ